MDDHRDLSWPDACLWAFIIVVVCILAVIS
jgi:hypothetical protein